MANILDDATVDLLGVAVCNVFFYDVVDVIHHEDGFDCSCAYVT